ncbi:14880_t:CDS:2 [Acaulospora morrowiae]|uniref:14880_t:CDS:1 n=1 Tax=Acaulospora morrowiae TaxID=94023 RepID=A0A9N9G769_9GLOM|nr:14880_t:CDS:2 [Acaulospora morrowiae]
MYSKILEEVRELGERLRDTTIRKFHKRLTRNPAEETIKYTEVEEEENSDSAKPSRTREWGVVIAFGQSFGADFHWRTSFPSYEVVPGPSFFMSRLGGK